MRLAKPSVSAHFARALSFVFAVTLAGTGCNDTASDRKCEVACQCNDGVQYRGAGFCDRTSNFCVSGEAVCQELCETNEGLEMICSEAQNQPAGHVVPQLVCPGVDPVDKNCDRVEQDCRVQGTRASGSSGSLTLLGLGLLALSRRRKRRVR